MNHASLRRHLLTLFGFVLLSFGSLAAAEPPSRAARLGELDGTVSFSPAGQPNWMRAVVNRPLTRGDRLWTASGSRAEVQIGGAAIRLGPSTSMVLLNLDNRIAQLQLSQGTLKIRVRSLGPRQTFEVATPNLAFTLRRPGEYRIEVDPNDDATAVRVTQGSAEVYGQGASYTVDSRRSFRFYGTDLSDFDTLTAQRDDELDRWSRERDRRGERSVSARYVSSEVVGFEDLDNNGTWRVDVNYGSVWTPTRVAAGWTPYRDGHWSWIDPWGWTWVDDAPWGYAVSHYGRWARIDSSWAWVPGPRRERAVYAPALVAFIGGKNFQATVSVGGGAANVGWFPLAPREVYQPSYAVSRSYFDSVNRSNAVIAPATINNIYNIYNTSVVNNTTTVNNSTLVTQVTQVNQVIYANQRVTGAVIAVPTQAFVQAQPVAKARVQLAPEALISAPVVRVASVVPVQQSVQGGAREAVAKPPALVQAVVARTAPPPAPMPFVEQQTQLAAKPGTPIDEAQRSRPKPAGPAAQSPPVSVVATAPTASALPPATAPGGKTPDARKAAADKADNGRRAEGESAARATPDSAPAGSADVRAAEARAAEAKATEAGRAEAARSERAKAEAGRAESSKAQAEKAEAARIDAANSARVKGEAAKAEAVKAEASRAAAAKAAMDSAEASRVAAAKADAAKTAQANADAGRAADAKAQSGRADEAKAERARAEAAKAEAAKAESTRAQAAQAASAKDAVAKAGQAKAEAAKAEADKAEAGKAAAAKAQAAKDDASKAAASAKPPASAVQPGRRARDPKADGEEDREDGRKKGNKP